MIVPADIAPACSARADTSAAGLVQRSVTELMRTGAFAAHAAHMRRVYGIRYNRTLLAANAYLRDFFDIDAPPWGLAITLRPKQMNQAAIDALCQRLLQRKVIVSPMDGIKLSFAAVNESRIAEGIGIIASLLATS